MSGWYCIIKYQPPLYIIIGDGKNEQIPAMSVHVTPDRHKHIVWVSVIHAPGQSINRAVEPRAKKEFKDWVSKNIMFGSLELESVIYGTAVVQDRVVTRYKFTY